MSIAAYEDGFDICQFTQKRIFISEYKAYIYAKRVREGRGENDLSPEESEAVRVAMEGGQAPGAAA